MPRHPAKNSRVADLLHGLACTHQPARRTAVEGAGIDPALAGRYPSPDVPDPQTRGGADSADTLLACGMGRSACEAITTEMTVKPIVSISSVRRRSRTEVALRGDCWSRPSREIRRSGRLAAAHPHPVQPYITGRSARPWPDSVDGDRLVVHARRWPERKVIQAGRDERTRLRFSRISIARCADLIRYSASAWGPLSRSVHPRHGSTRHGPKSLPHRTFGRAA